MQGNARAETGPERELRSALHRRGLRFRKNHSPVVGVRCRVDVAFTAARVAVFLDGCFWHSCPEHGTLPRTNADWWRVKLAANKDRDLRNDVALTTAGWTVLRLWEHEPVEEMVERVVAVLGSSYAASSSVSVH
jgi:DNA mismatch endonuclease (patch repair protein)